MINKNRHYTNLILIFFALALYGLVFPPKVYAYLDPGTGSLILQIILSVFLAGSFAARKIIWPKIRNFFLLFFSRKNNEQDK
ncbi:MAG: hypothetical protein QG641_1225 [Candidatus Poribacteria bacterium]|nr:hypothetical protein [Candidatus Poribacteria bacterium]